MKVDLRVDHHQQQIIDLVVGEGGLERSLKIAGRLGQLGIGLGRQVGHA